MPSPFPGFDPYLESPAEWRSFHNAYISALAFALNERLPPPFVARQDSRLYVVAHSQNIYPDVLVSSAYIRSETRPMSNTRTNPAVLTPEKATAPLQIVLSDDPIRESFIEIRMPERETPVAVVELLSPTNKRTLEGRAEYRRKQNELMRSEVHLIEIDLLRGGDPDMNLTPRSVVAAAKSAPFDYLICLHRGGSGLAFSTWPFGVREPMPTISVPLVGDLPDILINLRRPFDEVYERGLYQRTLDYKLEPEPPLNPADALWADALLRGRGFRRDEPHIKG